MSDFVIIGGGSTVADYDTRGLYLRSHVIGVNDSALWANVNTAFTMDRLWYEARYRYLAAKRIDDIWVREGCDRNVKNGPKIHIFESKNSNEMTTQAGSLNGANSGICAINLAFQWSQSGDRVFLLGFDMMRHPQTNAAYWYPDYEWKAGKPTKLGTYADWSKNFGPIMEQFKHRGVELWNVTHRSLVPAKVVPQIHFKQLLSMLP